MEILKRNLAPITPQGWAEIEEEAKNVLNNNLSGRRLVSVDGPKGLDFTAVSRGRLGNLSSEKSKIGEVNWGVHEVQPLVEVRIPFTLDVWELDNAVRGAKDIDLDNLTAAAKKAAEFEDNAIFHGFKAGNITGLLQAAEKQKGVVLKDMPEFLSVLAQTKDELVRDGIEGPYSLAINPGVWAKLVGNATGYPLHRQVAEQFGVDVVFTPRIDHALLLSGQADHFELVLGQDLSIGYIGHQGREVTLYISESFTFVINEPDAIIPLRSQK